VQPFGPTREDQRAGTIAASIVNVYRKRGKKPLEWHRFFPTYDQRKPQNDWRGLLAKVENIVKAMGGEDKRK
jgi:hypothetical protein